VNITNKGKKGCYLRWCITLVRTVFCNGCVLRGMEYGSKVTTWLSLLTIRPHDVIYYQSCFKLWVYIYAY
jgi:hypothetical protein